MELEDQNGNYLGDGGSYMRMDGDALSYGCSYCSFCLKQFFKDGSDEYLRAMSKRHSLRCKHPFGNDTEIVMFTTNDVNDKKKMNAVFNMSGLSRVFNGWDFRMTTKKRMLFHNSIVFLYVEDGMVLGLLTTAKKKFKNMTHEDVLVQEFFVVPYKQRKGIGKKLLDACADFYKTRPSLMVFDKPSFACQEFLLKKYKMEMVQMVR